MVIIVWFSSYDAAYIFNRRQIWTLGRPVKHMHSLPMKPRCCNLCRMRPDIVLLKWTCSSWEKLSSWWQHVSLQNSNISLGINGTPTCMQITHAITEARVVSLVTAWMVFHLISKYNVRLVLLSPRGYVYHGSMKVSQTIVDWIVEPSRIVLLVTFSVLFCLCPKTIQCGRCHILLFLFLFIYKVQLGLSVKTQKNVLCTFIS